MNGDGEATARDYIHVNSFSNFMIIVELPLPASNSVDSLGLFG